ncbi:MAG: tRNA(Ile)-lysidine synthase [Oceanicoccus sp.]|jgi:tRNA(Ile)-lysidine synthase
MKMLSAQSLLTTVAPYLTAPRWLVAYSGGVDSHVLLTLLSAIANHPPIIALYIDHQLHPQSKAWAEHCRQQAVALGLPFKAVTVDVAVGGNLEAKARNARYQAFGDELQPAEVLMLGHHQDDQVETFMLRLLRGSGRKGAAAMPRSRPLDKGLLLRPLLDYSRVELEIYANQQQLRWIEDPSNASLDFDRNFLRQQWLPELAKRWPQYRQTLTRAAKLSDEAAQLNQQLAELDADQLSVDLRAEAISITVLQTLPPIRQKNLLRYWLQRRRLPMPSAQQCQAMLDQVINAGADAEPLLQWPGVDIRRFKSQLYAMPALPAMPANQFFAWSHQQPIALAGVGTLSAEPSTGNGLAVDRISAELHIRFRIGGERCQPAGRPHSQTLKKLLQEYTLPPWLRDRVPLLYCGDDLVAVGDLFVCEGWQASPQQAGLVLRWLRSTNTLTK